MRRLYGVNGMFFRIRSGRSGCHSLVQIAGRREGTHVRDKVPPERDDAVLSFRRLGQRSLGGIRTCNHDRSRGPDLVLQEVLASGIRGDEGRTRNSMFSSAEED